MQKQLKYPILIINVVFLLVFIFFAPSLFAQNDSSELKLNIQLRPRAEFRNGLFTPILESQKPASFISQRSRLGVTYSKNQKLQLGLSTQVVTTWGNDPQVQNTANDISLYEAWARINFNPSWSLKVGRQVLSYDDERILGKLDWNNAGRKHDAALLKFEKEKFRADAAFAFNQNSERSTGTFYNSSNSQPYKSMQLLWMKYSFSKTLSASALAMNLNFQNPADSGISNLQTMGANLFYAKNKLHVNGTFYYQSGNMPLKNSSSIKTGAWMASAKILFNVNNNAALGIGSDFLSGRDMNATSSKITYFNPLYGTGHKFYGAMDYFYVASPHHNVGLWDSYLNLDLNASEKLSFQIALHHFTSTAAVINYSGNKAAPTLGNEADISFGYNIMKEVKLSGGYSQMFTDPSMRYVKNILPSQEMKSLQNWVWLSLNINPEILLYKSK
ncbi:MAG: alginate export family protein [Ginsengibacter sp.]